MMDSRKVRPSVLSRCSEQSPFPPLDRAALSAFRPSARQWGSAPQSPLAAESLTFAVAASATVRPKSPPIRTNRANGLPFHVGKQLTLDVLARPTADFRAGQLREAAEPGIGVLLV